MKVRGFVFQPRARVEFTEAEIMVLKRLCENHYDATVRSLVPPGHGAVINGLLNSIKDGAADHDLTNDQVQLLCKACEMAVYLPNKDDRQSGTKLHWELAKVIDQLNDEWRRVNPELAAW